MADEHPSAQVTVNQIFDEVRKTSQHMVEMRNELKHMQEDVNGLKYLSEEIREAHSKAETAERIAAEAKEDLKTYMEQCDSKDRHEKKYRISIISLVVTVLIFILPIFVQYYI